MRRAGPARNVKVRRPAGYASRRPWHCLYLRAGAAGARQRCGGRVPQVAGSAGSTSESYAAAGHGQGGTGGLGRAPSPGPAEGGGGGSSVDPDTRRWARTWLTVVRRLVSMPSKRVEGLALVLVERVSAGRSRAGGCPGSR